MKTFVTTSEEQTQEIGEMIAKELETPCVILLKGLPGAGKTAITRGLVKGFSVTAHVNSPTFCLMNLYKGVVEIHHYDLYRLQYLEDVEDIGFFQSDADVIIVEWPDLVEPYIENAVKITISGHNERKIEIEG